MSKTKVFIGLVGLAVLFGLFAPPLYKDKLIGAATFYTNERKCFNYYKKLVNDPGSAYLASSYVMKRAPGAVQPPYLQKIVGPYDEVMRVQIQSRNGFGAYAPVTVTCPMVDGQIDDDEIFAYRLANTPKAK